LQDPISEIPIIKKQVELAEWLKVKALCSNPSTAKKRKYPTKKKKPGLTELLKW
jgi:hypothetical protein